MYFTLFRSDVADRVEPVPGTVAALETAVLTVAIPAVGYWLHPDDPFFLDADYPWIVLGPALTGLRFGFAYGFSSALILIFSMALAWRYGWPPMEMFPKEFAIGLLLMGMISGEFYDMWMRKLVRVSTMNEYRRMKLDEFTRAYHLIKESHDILERRLSGSSQSLREAILNIREKILQSERTEEPFMGMGGLILELLAVFGGIQAAALHEMDAHGNIKTPAAATLGHSDLFNRMDPVAQQTLESRKLTSIRQELVGNNERDLKDMALAAIPLIDVNETLRGVMIVYQMKFMNLHDDNLRMLSILGGHIGDIIGSSGEVAITYDMQEESFLRHLHRSLEDRRKYNLPAVVVRLLLEENEYAEDILSIVMNQRRGLDQVWVVDEFERFKLVLILMPYTDETGVEGYSARIENFVQEKFGVSIHDTGVNLSVKLIGKKDTYETIIGQIMDTHQ